MNLRNNKGYTGSDIIISILIIMIFIPTIVALIYSIDTKNNEVERKNYAMTLSCNIIETLKSIDIDKLKSEENLDDINNKIRNFKASDSEITDEDGKITFSSEDTDGNRYVVFIKIEDYKDYSGESNIEDNVVKKITVTTEYRINKDTKNVEISTLKTIE